MISENSKKRIVFGPMTKMIISAAVIFAAVLLFTPEAGILRTIPFLFFAGIVSGFLGTDISTSAALAGLFNLCIYFVCGSGVKNGVAYSVLAVAYVVMGICFQKLVMLSIKSKKTAVKRRAVVLCTVCFVLAVVLTLIFCGNPVSFVINDGNNTSQIVYLNKHYNDDSKVVKKYTSFSPKNQEYRTYVTFKHDGNIVGAADDCYISLNDSQLHDDVRKYYEDEMLFDAKKTMANIVKNVTTAFEITAADVTFENDEVLDGKSEYTQYQDRVGYVVSFYSIIDNEDDFASLCYDVVTELKNNGFDYQEVLFCGGTSSEVLFFAKATLEIDYNEFSSKWCVHFDDHFAADSLKRYAVTEEMILGYWNNP